MFPQIDKKQMGQRLKQIMKEKNVTPKEVQQYLSLSCVQTVYRWMEGVNVPCVDHLYALSILLEVTVEELVIGRTKKSEYRCPLSRWNGKGMFLFREPAKQEKSDGGTGNIGVYEVERWEDTALVRLGMYHGTAERLPVA